MSESVSSTENTSLKPVDPTVEGSLEWSLLTVADLPELAELRLAIDYFDRPVESVDFESMMALWIDPLQEAERNAIVGRNTSGSIMSYAWNRVDVDDPNNLKVWLDGGSHPAVRRQSLDRKLLAWQIERVLDWMHEPGHEWAENISCCRHVNASNEIYQKTAERVGMKPYRWYLDMAIELADKNFTIADTENIAIVPWDDSYCDSALACHNRAFSTRPGSHPVLLDDWLASYNRLDSKPEWSWLALSGEQVVGYAISSVAEPRSADDTMGGWTDRLGVLPEYRGRKIASNLLLASLGSFKQAGCSWAGIGVDTEKPKAACDAFTRLGYEVEDAVILYATQLSKDMRSPLGLLE